MESVKSAKNRMKKYPLVLGMCSKEASVYAACVLAKKENVKIQDCASEFKIFKTCLEVAAKSLNTRL